MNRPRETPSSSVVVVVTNAGVAVRLLVGMTNRPALPPLVDVAVYGIHLGAAPVPPLELLLEVEPPLDELLLDELLLLDVEPPLEELLLDELLLDVEPPLDELLLLLLLDVEPPPDELLLEPPPVPIDTTLPIVMTGLV